MGNSSSSNVLSSLVASSIVANFTLPTDLNQLHYKQTPYFENLEVDQDTGNVYVGAKNWIFQLDANLAWISSTKTAPPHYYTRCYSEEECQEKAVPEALRNKNLLLNPDFSELITCNSDENSWSTCASWHFGNETAWKPKTSSKLDGFYKSRFAFLASENSGLKPKRNVLSVGTVGTDGHALVSSHSLRPEENFNVTFQIAQRFGGAEGDPTSEYSRVVYGFSSGGFSYYLTHAKNITREFSRLIRVCQNASSYPYAFADVPITCETGFEIKAYFPTAAYLGFAGGDLAKDLNVTTEQDTLFVVFSTRESRDYKSPLCIYSMQNIRDTFDMNMENFTPANTSKEINRNSCRATLPNPVHGNFPITAKATTVFAEMIDEIKTKSKGVATIIFTGTIHGVLDKYILIGSSGAVQYFTSGRFDSRFLPDLKISFDSTGQTMYLMGSKMVSKLPMYFCSHLATLESCLDAPDPFCGWCTKQNKCTSEEQCFGNPRESFFLFPGETENRNEAWITCTLQSAHNFQLESADVATVDLQKWNFVTISTEYPVICFKHVECLYSHEPDNPVSGQVIIGSNYKVRCPTPADSHGISSKTVELLIKIGKKGLFPTATYARTLTFYDCSYFGSLDDCVSLELCGWNSQNQQCQSNAECVFRMKILDETTSPALNQAYNITCKLQVRPNLTVRMWWTRNGANLTLDAIEEDTDLLLILPEDAESQLQTLIFNRLQLKHLGEYTCHSAGGISKSKLVSVDSPPSLRVSPTSNVSLGSRAELKCIVTGYPLNGSISWMFGNQKLQNTTEHVISSETTDLASVSSSISIPSFTPAYNGTYTCKFSGEDPQEAVGYLTIPVEIVDLTWTDSSHSTSEAPTRTSVIHYESGEPVLLNCHVPNRIPPSEVRYSVQFPNGTSTILRTSFIQGSRQVLVFLSDTCNDGELRCSAEVHGEQQVFRSAPIGLQLFGSSLESYSHEELVFPDLIQFWGNCSTCSLKSADNILDTTVVTGVGDSTPRFFTIAMDPPEIRVYEGPTILKTVPLPEASTTRDAKRAVIKADLRGLQVIWTHSSNGHLWLTNVETGSSTPLKKNFGVFDMEVDWKAGVVFGVSEEDNKCILKLDLKDTRLVTKFRTAEAITSIAVTTALDSETSAKYLHYVTESSKIIRLDLRNGAELQVFKDHRQPHDPPKSLIYNENGVLWWVQDFFGKVSVLYAKRNGFQYTQRYPATGLVRGIRSKTPLINEMPNSNCTQCSHFCNPAEVLGSCGCPWGLGNFKEGSCAGDKWIHIAIASASEPDVNLVTYDLSTLSKTFEQASFLSRVKLVPRTGFGQTPCFIHEIRAQTAEIVCENRATWILEVAFDSVLHVLETSNSTEVDVIFITESCIQILLLETNETWTLFCGDFNEGNVLLDTKSWIAFWEDGEKNVYMTYLDSLVDLKIVDKRDFQLPKHVLGRLAVDSNSSILYWIHGSRIWSRSYKNMTVSEPILIWNSPRAIPKQLQFHNGFLYWIESSESEKIIIFDIHFGSKETLFTASDGKFESFSIQTAVTEVPKSPDECRKCSHFCTANSFEGPRCWCPWEKPILASNGSCHKATVNIVRSTENRNVFEVLGSPENTTKKILLEAPAAGTRVFASSQNFQCWLQGSQNELQCSSDGNDTTIGCIHRTNPLFSLSSSGSIKNDLIIFNTGNETGKYGNLTLANVSSGQKLQFQPVKQDQKWPFAFDHVRKLAVWCTNRDLKFHEVGGSHLDSYEPSIEVGRCVCEENAKTYCTSLALDEAKGRAYFIHGDQIRRLDYVSKSSTPLVTTLHQIGYSHANSLSFDPKGYLFWVGGFSESGEFVDMIKVPERAGEMVSSIRILEAKNKILQVEAVWEFGTTDIEDPCDGAKCQYFCFPKDRWTLNGTTCYCPTNELPEGDTIRECEPLYKEVERAGKGVEQTFTTVAEADDSLLKIIIGASSGVVVLALILFGVLIKRRRKNQEEDYQKALTLFLEGDQDSAKMIQNPAERSYYVPFSQIIPPEDINLTDAKQLGSGQFGAVFLAKYKDEPAAVKVIKHGSDKEQMKEFLKEIKIMAYIGEHANIVHMYGAEVSNLEKGGVLVVLELCPHGDLETFLRKHKQNLNNVEETEEETSVGFSSLADWSRQIAHGLAYLEEKQVVHGDLATRNVLLFHNNAVKVSDFGFSRKTYGKQYTKSNKQTPLPYRWAAPETLDQMVFSTQTDVWSYGVTVWEIFTLGNCPFAQQSWDLSFSTRLREGMRLEKPEMATEEIYEGLMNKCWQVNPDDRLTFVEICGFWNEYLGLGSERPKIQGDDQRYTVM